MTVHVPGAEWSDLTYEIAAWFAKNELREEIADPACQGGRSSRPLSVTPSLPSSNPVAERRGGKRMRVRFGYPVRKGDFDWRELASAALGEDGEGLEGLGGTGDCSKFGNHGGAGRESESGKENDHVDDMLMKINQAGYQVAGGSCSERFVARSLWVEVGSRSAVLGELGGELGRLEELGLLLVS